MFFLISDYVVSSTEALEGIDLGETTHKKAGTTVPESIHSFSELPAYSDLSDFFVVVLQLFTSALLILPSKY